MEEKLITKIWAEEIEDSRGNPTIKVSVFAGNVFDSFSVPSGASTGIHEAHVIENNKAIFKVNEIIAKALVGKNVLDQKEIDKIMIELDGTFNKDNLGGNSMIGVSIAAAKAAAKVCGQETFEYLRTLAEIRSSRKVPYLYMNLINGGKHASDGLAFQEYLVVPETDNAQEALEIGIKIDNSLKEIIKKDLGEDSLSFGDEGGFAPKTDDIKKPLLYLNEAIEQNNFQDKVRLALDVASSSFFNNEVYKISGKNVSKEELLDIYNSLVKEFDLLSLEDPFEQEDFESFAELKTQNQKLLVVGDDLTVSNILRLKEAIEKKSISAMIIKPNQIGTLTETLQTMKLARENNIELIVSHRSGETNDDFIADLAYAFGCYGLKAGAPTKPERMVKYERLIKITNY
jgi:enolase